MLLCFNGSNTGGNTAVLHQREWEWQWDKLRLFYERLAREGEGDLEDEADLGEAGELRVVVEEGLGDHRRWVVGWVEADHNTVAIITVDDDISSLLCCVNKLMKDSYHLAWQQQQLAFLL